MEELYYQSSSDTGVLSTSDTSFVDFQDLLTKQYKSGLEEDRDATMDWLSQYYKEPVTVDNVSYRIDELVKPGSDYLTQAGDDSEASAIERGYLESGFNRGAGEVEAIDNAYTVAYEDAKTDTINANYDNTVNAMQYQAAWRAASESQWAKANFSYNEFNSDLDAYSKDFFNDFNDQYLDRQSELDKEKAQLDQDLLLEVADKQEEYFKLLRQQGQDDERDALAKLYEYDLKNSKLAGDRMQFQLDQGLSAQEQLTFLSLMNSERQGLMRDITQISLAEMYPTQKADQINQLIGNWNSLQDTWLAEYPEYAGLISQDFSLDTTGKQYTWNASTYDYAKNSVQNFLKRVHDMTVEAVDDSDQLTVDPAFQAMAYVVRFWDDMPKVNPKAFESILQWFTAVGASKLDERHDSGSYIKVLEDLKWLTSSIMVEYDKDFKQNEYRFNESTQTMEKRSRDVFDSVRDYGPVGEWSGWGQANDIYTRTADHEEFEHGGDAIPFDFSSYD